MQIQKSTRRHLMVGGISLLIGTVIFFSLQFFSTEIWRDASNGRKANGLHWRLGVATGSTALGLMATTLIIGPLRVLSSSRRPAINRPLRRTTGQWAAGVAWLHVLFGITIHSEGWRIYVPFLYFRHYTDPLLVAISTGFWLGALAAAILVPIFLTSNSKSLHKLGGPSWKKLQRLNYLVFGLVVTHVALLQYQERRDLRHVAVTFTVIGLVALLQFAGFRRVRQLRPVTS